MKGQHVELASKKKKKIMTGQHFELATSKIYEKRTADV